MAKQAERGSERNDREWGPPSRYSRDTGIGTDKIRAEIAAGRLRAVNVAAEGSQRPRWLIHQDDFQQWIDSRANVKRPTVERKPRKNRWEGFVKEFI